MQETTKDLILKAHECIENGDLTGAMEMGKKILDNDSDNMKGLEIMGYIMLELNCLDEAKFCFTNSIENRDNDSHVPYLYLGQLTDGEESEKYFLQAIVMMTKNLNESEEKILFKPTKLDVSNAYVSLCELYMTDLCDKEDAEAKCTEYVKKAIEMDSTNPASWQSLASLNLVKNDVEKAKEYIEKSLDLWVPAYEKAKIDGSSNDTVPTCELSIEIRVKCAEVLYELQMFKNMKPVLESILNEDDESFQANYLMALTLENLMDQGENKEEFHALIEEHADIAISLANPVLEAEAILKMTSLLEKIGVQHNSDSEEEDESGSDDEEMVVDKQ